MYVRIRTLTHPSQYNNILTGECDPDALRLRDTWSRIEAREGVPRESYWALEKRDNVK